MCLINLKLWYNLPKLISKLKLVMWIIDLIRNKIKLQSKGLELASINNIIPSNIIELLWFSDGKLKNYENSNSNTSKFSIDWINFEISFKNWEEPSAISEKLIFIEPKNISLIEKLDYYPSYKSLNPEQRWIYLNWLIDIDSVIDIGYVFIFYYWLERHLFFGNTELAFDTIMRLRTIFNNRSFLNYSSSALIATSIINQRKDWALKYFEAQKQYKDFSPSSIYLLAKKFFWLWLNANEIISMANKVGFKNIRYIKDERWLFEEELNKLLIKDNHSQDLSLENFPLPKSLLTEEIILANYSLNENQRIIQIPSLYKNKEFVLYVYNLLQTTHENVKQIIKLKKDVRFV